MRIYTIGFTKKTAEEFFTLLAKNHVDLLVDIRLNPNSQLSGFSKQENLPYFLKNLISCDYCYEPDLAPTKEILSAYRKDKDWPAYENQYLKLLAERGIPQKLDKEFYETKTSCLLCSEPESDYCHRRLAAEYIKQFWDNLNIRHI